MLRQLSDAIKDLLRSLEENTEAREKNTEVLDRLIQFAEEHAEQTQAGK